MRRNFKSRNNIHFLNRYIPILNESISIKGKNNQKRGSIWINGNEGTYPHCHFYHNDFRCDEVCICLHTNAYFIHKSHTNKFKNKKEKIIFNKIMESRYEKDKTITIWRKLVLLWNEVVKNTTNEKFSIDLSKVKQPNYSNITKTIQDI